MNDINDTHNTDDNDASGQDTDPGGTSVPAGRRPLGYWLRAVDGLLTREFARALDAEGLGRRDWMLLSVLSGDIEAPGLRERLTRKGKRLRGLEERGWVEQHGDGTWALTDLGRSEKERVGEIVDAIRARVVGALGDDEAYAALTASLEAIAREFGWDENAAGRGGLGAPEHHGHGFGPGFGHGFGREFGPGFRPGFDPDSGAGFRPWFGPGFRPGFGPVGRPFPFDPASHGGNQHRGFRPGRPGRPAERFDEPLRGYGDDGCRGHHPHGSHSHHDDETDHGRSDRRTQHAYERGFDAGFARGRSSGAA